MLMGMLEYNFFGEVFERPVSVVYSIKNFHREFVSVEIFGIDAIDCLGTFEKRKVEFDGLEGSVALLTPRLSAYNKQRSHESA
jgi:hypothetical protein